MKLTDAIKKFREYHPDTSKYIWGKAFEIICSKATKTQDPTAQPESYPTPWIHATIHLNPETGEMHSDGDHQVRHWIQDKIHASNIKNPDHINEALSAKQ